MKINLKKICAAGVLLAFAIILPQIFHLSGVAQSGKVFLPMHIPVLITGFVAGKYCGMAVGALSPLFSFLLTGMPTSALLPFMMIELCAYGFAAGFIYHNTPLGRIKGSIYYALIGAMLTGRLVYALSLATAASVFGIPCGGAIAAVNATIAGAAGIIIQIVLIPLLIFALEKSGIIRSINGEERSEREAR